jgi:hypothetical protein
VSGTEPAPERLGVHEVRERELAIDLDGRQELPVARLELGPAADVDELEVDPELLADLLDDFERPGAEAAVRRVVDRDAGYGYRPRVVVASATRSTASPYEAMRRLVA